MPNHKFDDPVYDQQKQLLAENQEDALQKGIIWEIAFDVIFLLLFFHFLLT